MKEEEFVKLLENESSNKPINTRLASFFGITTGALAIFLSVASVPFILPFFRRFCLPFVPATQIQIDNVLEGLRGRTGKVIDLGCGDGRIVLAAAKTGFEAHGLDLNPWLVMYSKFSAFRQGLYDKSKFQTGDLWKFNLKPYNNIVVFGVGEMMYSLEKKFQAELNREAQIVVCRYPLPNLTPIRTIGNGMDTVWVYGLK